MQRGREKKEDGKIRERDRERGEEKREYTHAFRGTGEVVLVAAARFGLNGLVLHDVGHTAFRANAVDCLACLIVRTTGERPGNVPEIAARGQLVDRRADLSRAN